jgi:hypothetical protein
MANTSTTLSRKAVLQSLAVLPGVMAMLAGATRASAKSEPTGQVGFRYMGTAAWEIRDEKTVILIDPYVSRIVGPRRREYRRIGKAPEIRGLCMAGTTSRCRT